MKLNDALNTISNFRHDVIGYRVRYYFDNNTGTAFKHFPDIDEPPILDLAEAMYLASVFAASMVGTYYNIHVVNNNYTPIPNYGNLMYNRNIEMSFL